MDVAWQGDGVLSCPTCREREMMGFEGEVAVRSNEDRRSRPENNENFHLTMERMCLHSIGDVRSAFFESRSVFKVDRPDLVLLWSESNLR